MIVEFFSRIASPLSFAIVVVGFKLLAITVMGLARGWSTSLGLGSGPPVVSAWATVAGGLCFTTLHDWPHLCGGGPFLRSNRALRALEQNGRPKTPQFNDDLLRQMVT